jgi:Zn-finger nucleic acid-binding protein
MRCATCNQPIDPARADDGGMLRCACGAEIEIAERRRVRPVAVEVVATDARAAVQGDPYRSASPDAVTSGDGVPLDLASFRRHEGEELRCPRCAHPLGPLGNDVACRGCHGCGGVFVDAAALDRPREELRGVVEPETSPSPAKGEALDVGPYVRCPVCRDPMTRTVFGKRSGVVVDVCRAHGSWFDPGELARVVEFVERGGLEEAQRRAAEAAAKRPARAVELDASLLSDAVRDARSVGRWEGRLSMGRWTLLDVLRDLLEGD